MLEKTEGRKRRGKQDEMVRWHHQLDGHEFEQVLGVGDGQGSLACCSPWGHKIWTQLSDFTFTFHFHALEKEMATTPVFLPGESRGWRSLVGCHLWGRTESDTTEVN